jgi:ribosomal 50S subunit-associated protein YjgA (DUF615 family)
MDIFTIKSNLENTIAGKEMFLVSEREKLNSEDAHERMVAYIVVKMLDVNIDELKRILADVEVVANKTINEIYRNG